MKIFIEIKKTSGVLSGRSFLNRKIGGLGIFMVKKNMDDMQYIYRDGQNRLRITKCV